MLAGPDLTSSSPDANMRIKAAATHSAQLALLLEYTDSTPARTPATRQAALMPALRCPLHVSSVVIVIPLSVTSEFTHKL
jgi:uncharacterized protein (DUF952 family)